VRLSVGAEPPRPAWECLRSLRAEGRGFRIDRRCGLVLRLAAGLSQRTGAVPVLAWRGL